LESTKEKRWCWCGPLICRRMKLEGALGRMPRYQDCAAICATILLYREHET
jgi:hypothetical protein